MSPNPQVVMPMAYEAPKPREKTSKEKHVEGEACFEAHVLPVVQAAVRSVTEKECTQLFNVAPSDLSEAVSGASKRGRSVRFEWIIQLLLHAPVAVKIELLGVLSDIAGCKPPERKEHLKLEDKHRVAMQFIDSVPGGREWFERELGRYEP